MAQQMDGNVSYYFHPKTNRRFSDNFPIPTAVLIEFEKVSNPSILHGCVSPRPSCRFQVESPPNSCLKTARTNSQNWLPLVGNEGMNPHHDRVWPHSLPREYPEKSPLDSIEFSRYIPNHPDNTKKKIRLPKCCATQCPIPLRIPTHGQLTHQYRNASEAKENK